MNGPIATTTAAGWKLPPVPSRCRCCFPLAMALSVEETRSNVVLLDEKGTSTLPVGDRHSVRPAMTMRYGEGGETGLGCSASRRRRALLFESSTGGQEIRTCQVHTLCSDSPEDQYDSGVVVGWHGW